MLACIFAYEYPSACCTTLLPFKTSLTLLWLQRTYVAYTSMFEQGDYTEPEGFMPGHALLSSQIVTRGNH